MIEHHFKHLDQLVEEEANRIDGNYLDTLIDILNLKLIESDIKEEAIEDKTLIDKVKQLEFETLKKDQVRKVIELAILKGLKDGVQSQHLITPDTIASYMVYIIEKVFHRQKEIRIFDLVSGSGNLLTAVMNQLNMSISAYGSEVDPTLIELSLLSASLQKNQVEFFHQDSIQPFLLDPVDLVIADLPVGYYPDDERAKSFKVHVDHNHTYAHHLLIEQGLKYTKEAGFLIFVIPNSLFSSDQAQKLHMLIHETAHVVALLQLPASIFKSEQNAKSLFVLQKKGEKTTAPKEVLLAQLPSFKDIKATENIVNKMNHWFDQAGY
ncbi:class I SAM-dependent methyltransferase [Amphibacillus sp. MSJ-3]|uniref:class I SAM-dependent methyltransferase n=1 Tax=Amphibacillus sp. MSJ-3 TaxID=2841505 RepID=UPI001C0EC7DE|nr:class I SAM-dependent methyltransferase [Amphibacillus sp. MSJ-3]MBU5593675.1 class I SAM-dependent methyltransferase [Amphibacillus sp. MSJ-3]